MALKISRLALLSSLIAWALLFALGYFRVIGALGAFGLSAYAGIGIGLSAAACVFFQGLSYKPKSKDRQISN